MQWIKNIATLLLGAIFMATSSGIVIYQSHCICTGDDQVSLYVLPETCEDESENQEHTNHCKTPGNTISEMNGCESSSEERGCEKVKIQYFKLEDQVVQEKSRKNTVQPIHVDLPVQTGNWLLSFHNEPEELQVIYEESPPIIFKSTDYLILIQQLKIPASA